MISNSKQNWTTGATVRVGFMTLRVRAAVVTPGDYAPDAYILSSLSGDKLYKFVPHNGLTAITSDEARSMIADASLYADRVVDAALEKAARISQIDAVFA